MSTIKPVSVKLDADIKARVEHLAEARKRSSHWMMREAIREYVEREEKREALQQEALRAWEEHQTSGLHVTGDEVVNWLESWGSENEKAAPSCHK
ncbi:CopG family ribbon-helix-helix protein [Shewanella xiamenensis]|uniref:CopG family ribbon-helix-helix protein n=1 Tax=Shewanella xiamenensis TaxID=332186 RepID=UPI00084995E5|nr:CopG family ribbon-helix-helix protein [Shewanella xiamenensis]ODR85638.1 CopG family transcriptional regulator [Shewanella xiamenensis]